MRCGLAEVEERRSELLPGSRVSAIPPFDFKAVYPWETNTNRPFKFSVLPHFFRMRRLLYYLACG